MTKTIQHWRRRQILTASKKLYEDNFKDSANWSANKMDKFLKMYECVQKKIAADFNGRDDQHPFNKYDDMNYQKLFKDQLTLFPNEQ